MNTCRTYRTFHNITAEMQNNASALTPTRFWTASRLSFFYVAFFAVVGIQMPFWPVWLESRGFGATEIGILLAVGTAGRIVVSPLIANLTDRLGERRRPMIMLCVGSLAVFGLFALTGGFWSVLVVTIGFIFLWAPIMPVGETLVLQTTREHDLQYGRVRLWGSISFIIAAVLAGRLLVGQSADVVFWLLAGTLGLTALSCFTLPDARFESKTKARPQFRQFLQDKKFVLFLLSAGLIQSSHGVLYAFGTLHWRSVGYSEDVIGWFWAEGVIAEVILFAIGAAVAKRLDPAHLIIIGGVAGIIRWTLTGLSDAFPVLLIVQALHACTFGAVHLGAMNFIMLNVPTQVSATAMSLYSSFAMGLAMGLSILVAGPLYGHLGSQAFLVMAVVAGVGTVVAFALLRVSRAPE
ncbi:MAG: 3-phenylpropionate MFS transporter [Rhodospirillales bacterium]|jgi:MFS transporter, PPP family, 3-phenylpropionic acid transporter|nr:3-phenylpropionate MFS transporter [Rhodospirillales bacterium]